MNTIQVALIGNPNSGKTTIFNVLTGSRQKVANYPGVTVEKKYGFRKYQESSLEIVDLPGIYSLTAHSEEEIIAQKYLVDTKLDVVVQIIDTANLHRSLFLTIQLMELGLPLVIVFNMMDIVKKEKMEIDIQYFSALLEVPIVPTIGKTKKGVENICKEIVQVAKGKKNYSCVNMNFSPPIEEAVALLKEDMHKSSRHPEESHRWHAIKLLEQEEISSCAKNVEKKALSLRHKIIQKTHFSPEEIIAKERFAFIDKICEKGITSVERKTKTLSDKIDAVLLHKFWGLPLFFAFVFLVFQFTFRIGNYPTVWLQNLFKWAQTAIVANGLMEKHSFFISLIVDGIIGGVGSVIVFLPNILLLFFALGFLEGTGYMARAAFLMDRFMHKIGLHGRSFVPMLLGFGCSVPAIMATRTLESRRDRIVTILVLPLIACSAKLVVFTLFIPAFFSPMWSPIILFLLYFSGILMAIFYALVLRKTLFKGENVGFVMELPPYHFPSVKSMMMQMWMRAYFYLKKAGTLILSFSIFLWILSAFPQKKELSKNYDQEISNLKAHYQKELINNELASSSDKTIDLVSLDTAQKTTWEQIEKRYLDAQSILQAEKQKELLEYSFMGRIGNFIEPVFRPLGFDWKIDTALIGAFAAKEVFVAQLGVVYAIGEKHPKALRKQLQLNYTPLQAFCVLLFILISIPCMGTFVVTKNEMGSWKWAWMQLGILTFIAYIITFVVYQIGMLIN